MNSITTKGGDKGMTSLYSGERASKSGILFETLGTLDELNSWLGLVKLKLNEESIQTAVESCQRCLFRLASNIATTPDSEMRSRLHTLDQTDLDKLERFEEELLSVVPMPETFIIPGMEERAAITDIARTICRRGERRLVELLGEYPEIDAVIDLKYLNRLSDVLYIIARYFEDGRFREK